MKPHVRRYYDNFQPIVTPSGTEYGCWCWGVWTSKRNCDLLEKPFTTSHHPTFIKVAIREQA